MSVQDDDVWEPRVRLRVMLAFLRIVAGRRGGSAVTWSGQGFTYTLTVSRGVTGTAVSIDADPEAEPDVLARIRDALYPAP